MFDQFFDDSKEKAGGGKERSLDHNLHNMCSNVNRWDRTWDPFFQDNDISTYYLHVPSTIKTSTKNINKHAQCFKFSW